MSSTRVPNPKDSMKSTWRKTSRADWTIAHWMFELLGLHHVNLDQSVPVHKKGDKVPYMSELYLHRWILVHAAIPVAVHHLIVAYTGANLTPVQAFVLYTAAFNLIAIHELHALRRTAHEVGFLDGDEHDRDGVPDVGVAKTLHSLLTTAVVRPVFTIFLSYRTSQPPSSMGWYWLPLEIGVYGLTVDFWFYWYHRLMHEVPFLWKFHRTHHLTKHPNPLLTLYADTEQELFDIAIVPLLAYFSMKLMGLPMGFYEWWVCHEYVVFAELAGHSGLRLHTSPPTTLGWLLRWLNAELIVEDHDLHHRKGWKSSGNYGKQTRLWDRAFGTCQDRIECREDDIDWNMPVKMPLL